MALEISLSPQTVVDEGPKNEEDVTTGLLKIATPDKILSEGEQLDPDLQYRRPQSGFPFHVVEHELPQRVPVQQYLHFRRRTVYRFRQIMLGA